MSLVGEEDYSATGRPKIRPPQLRLHVGFFLKIIIIVIKNWGFGTDSFQTLISQVYPPPIEARNIELKCSPCPCCVGNV